MESFAFSNRINLISIDFPPKCSKQYFFSPGVNILAWNHKLFPYEIFRGHKLFPKGNCKFVNFQVHFCVDTVCNNSFLCAGVNK